MKVGMAKCIKDMRASDRVILEVGLDYRVTVRDGRFVVEIEVMPGGMLFFEKTFNSYFVWK
jgi:hypothetical protein